MPLLRDGRWDIFECDMSVSLSVCQSVCRSNSLSVLRSVGRSVGLSQSVSLSVGRLVGRFVLSVGGLVSSVGPFCPSVCHSVARSSAHLVVQSSGRPVVQSSGRPVVRSSGGPSVRSSFFLFSWSVGRAVRPPGARAIGRSGAQAIGLGCRCATPISDPPDPVLLRCACHPSAAGPSSAPNSDPRATQPVRGELQHGTHPVLPNSDTHPTPRPPAPIRMPPIRSMNPTPICGGNE